MLGITLALLAAVGYGASDFAGGLLSRRSHFLYVGLVGQATSAFLAIALALIQASELPGGPAIIWSVIAGIGGFAGTAALYHGLAAGNMAVAGPLSAVAAAGLPVIVDLTAGNALPVTGLAGVAAALPGIWLVSTSSKAGRASRTGVRDGFVAGLGFAVLFIGLERAGDGGGVWPVAVSQGTGLVGMLVVAALWRPAGARLSASGILPGVLGFSGSLLYLLATRSAPLALVAVVTSLYPAVTVGLAGVVLKERTTWAQGWGLLLCGAAVCSFALT